jgi:hypothetical protein
VRLEGLIAQLHPIVPHYDALGRRRAHYPRRAAHA